MVLLETQKLEVDIAGKSVCRNLDLQIQSGECWGLLGGNGIGKTTLLHTLAGLHTPTAGAVLLRGTPLNTLGRRQIARNLGLLLQDSEDPFASSALETALIGRHPHLERWGWEGPSDRALARNALAALDLGGMEGRLTSTLSGGERRRLAIATLLTQDPVIALLDEPTNHLDLHHERLVLQLLRERTRARDGAQLMVLHDINLALEFCDHLLLLFGNGQALLGPASEIASTANLERLYHHPLTKIEGPRGPLFVPT